MNHKWENNKCVKCGIIRDEIKSMDEKGNDILKYQYSANGKSWVVKRPDCRIQINIDNEVPFSIKNIINIKAPESTKNWNQDYSQLLKHPKWQRKRLEIMQRDNFKCCLCKDEETTLNIHHKEYINGNKPWEYSDDFLVTLCEDCHKIVEMAKSSQRNILNNSVLKIKNTDYYPEIYHFIDLEEDQNKPGFMVTVIAKDGSCSHVLSFGNHFGSFDRILEFINKIKHNG